MKFKLKDKVKVYDQGAYAIYLILDDDTSRLLERSNDDSCWTDTWVGVWGFNNKIFRRNWEPELIGGIGRTKLGKILYK